MIFTCIIPLLLFCRPSAIRRFIITIVIYAIYREVILVTVTHRPLIERLKDLPFFANFDSSTTVIFVVAVLFVGASNLHAPPNAAKSGIAFSVSDSVFSGGIFLETAARLSESSAEMASSNKSGGPTVASTLPYDTTSSRGSYSVGASFYHSQSAESLTCKIHELH